MANTPKVAAMEVYPVAGKDCNGAQPLRRPRPLLHPATFVVLTDDRGNTGIGEVPGGQENHPPPWRT